MEIWKDIEGYEGKYQVSNEGRVKALAWKGEGKGNSQKEHILRQADLRGYKRVGLCKNGITKTYQVHRLVAIAFIPNPNNYDIVDHINTIRCDNRVENLRWVTKEENNRNEITVAKHIGLLVNREDQSKKVYQYDLDGNLVGEFLSISEASRNGFNLRHISSCCNGKRKTHKGFLWSFNFKEQEVIWR